MARCEMRLRYSVLSMLLVVGTVLLLPQTIFAADSNTIWDECNGGLCGAPPSGGIGGGGAGGGPVLVSFEIGPYFYLQDDEDADGAHDIYDNCLNRPNFQDRNADGDMFGDACDNCPYVASIDQTNTDAGFEDGSDENPILGNPCDPDDDGDGILDEDDNCPLAFNLNQQDWDSDGLGDACDDDIDGDGIPNIDDPCDTRADTGNFVRYIDTGTIEDCEANMDSDGFPDDVDRCPFVFSETNDDSDGDGVGDACDHCPYDENHYALGDRCE